MFLFVIASNSQQVYFNNRYDHNGGLEVIWSVLAVDSGYLCAAGTGKVLLLRLDNFGNVVWKKEYGDTGKDYYVGISGSMVQTVDEGFALGGSVAISGEKSDGMIWNFDIYGDTLWTQQFGDTTYEEIFYQCKQTPDSGFILIGVTTKTDPDGDIWLLKTDKNGNFEWDTTYGGAGVEYGFSVDVCYDGGYILGGYTKSFGAGDVDAYVIRVNDTGNIQWSKTFGDIYLDGYAVVLQTSDSGYIIGTSISKYIMSTFYNQNQTRLIKLNNNGDVVWDKTYGEERYGVELYAIHELGNGNFVVIGQRANRSGTPPGNGWINGLILKVNSIGDSLWYRVYEYDTCEKNDDYFRDMKPTSDGGFIVAGFFVPRTAIPCNDTGTQDMWVMKLDSCGCAVPYCDLVCSGDTTGIEDLRFANEDFGFTVYPNPFKEEATVLIHQQQAVKNKKLIIYDMTGRNIRGYILPTIQSQLVINSDRIGAGMFFIQLIEENGMFYTKKIIITDL